MTVDNLPVPAELGEARVMQGHRDLDGWIPVLADVMTLAKYIQESELVPKDLRGRDAAIAAVILYGREIGLPPMTALRTSFVINGRVGLAAEAMRALVLAAGHEIVVKESTGSKAALAGRRAGTDRWQEVTWSLDVARHAGISLSVGAWSKWPRQMLKARATAELCRDLFPDVIGGFEATEEITEAPVTAETAPRTSVRRHRTDEAVSSRQSPDTGAAKSAEDAPEPATASEARPSAEPPQSPLPLPGEAGYDRLGTPPNAAPRPADADPAGFQPEPADDPRVDPGEWNRTSSQANKIFVEVHALGVVEREDRLALLSRILGRDVDTSSTMTRNEARVVLDTLERVKSTPVLRDSLTAAITAGEVAGWLPVEPEPPEDGEAPDPPDVQPYDVPLPLDDDDDPPRIL